MADFATVAELETFMGNPSGALGARGTAMLSYASSAIRSYTHQDLDAVTGRQEEHAGDLGRHILTTTQAPVTAITITVDAVAFTDFIWDEWGQDIHKTDWSSWDEGPIRITYDSGWASGSDEMAEIKTICLEVAARALGGNQAGSFETFGSEVPELRGAAPTIFLTQQEERKLDKFIPTTVG